MKYQRYKNAKATCTHCGYQFTVTAPINALRMECPECGNKCAKWNRWLKEMGLENALPTELMEKFTRTRIPQGVTHVRNAATGKRTALTQIGFNHKHVL